MYKPNNIYVDLARAEYIENVNRHIEVLTDLCGRGIMIQPTEQDFDDPYIGPHLADALRGPSIAARDRMRIFKAIRDRFYSEAGARHEIFERFNGTPVFLIKLLTMDRVEYAIDGPMVDLARRICGFGDSAELIQRAKAERARSEHKRPLPEYVRRQDIDTATHMGRGAPS
jgi:4-hydroxyphenylacetate 3-monooxygenase